MTNLKTIKEAVKQNIPLRQAEENIRLSKEEDIKEKMFKDSLNKLGVVLI